MKKYIFLYFCVFACIGVYSQDFKFGKVTKAELLEEKHPTEPEANAAILHKGVHIRIEYNQSTGFTQVKEVELRIKFYKS